MAVICVQKNLMREKYNTSIYMLDNLNPSADLNEPRYDTHKHCNCTSRGFSLWISATTLVLWKVNNISKD